MTPRMAILSLTILAGAAVTQQPAAAQGESAAAKVQRLVQTSGYSNRHPKPTAWIIAAKGPAIGNYEVFVAVSGDIVVIGAVAAKKSQIPLTPPVLQTLLRSNHDMDFVKVGLDGDGDAFVRIEISSRLLDAQEFKKIMDQVTAATDAVYTRIKPYLK
jgi:Putative bacterial sensory transduction regulator